MDSELFGHEKGAFSGALHAQRGRFESAHHGTLFFDELTELGLSVQAKILRAMQERSVQRLGNPALFPADVRLIAGSSHDLEQALKDEVLREDFYYRMNVVSIRMPALRERVDDLPLLVRTLADEQAQSIGGESLSFSDTSIEALQKYPWPGNVRELRNYIERCHILMSGEAITPDNMLPPDQDGLARAVMTEGAHGGLSDQDLGIENFHSARESFEKQFIVHHLEVNDWNVSRTAAEIGMERSQLHRKIKAFGLVQPDKEST
jgi:two-component system nitrogen regulation response regulator NtrX